MTNSIPTDRSLFSFGFDEASGKHLNGAYKAYVIDDFALWFQVYNHVYDENPFEKYPAAKKAFTSEIWESLPNEYSNNYVTNGNTRWIYQRELSSLFRIMKKSHVLNHLDRIEQSTIVTLSVISWGSINRGYFKLSCIVSMEIMHQFPVHSRQTQVILIPIAFTRYSGETGMTILTGFLL